MANSNAGSPRRLVQILCGLAAAFIATFLVQTFRAPPQIGTDDEVFATVDALFTALNSRDESRLDDCEERLLVLRESNQLPAKAADHLDSVLEQARSGQWEPAAKRLYEFMYRQRREGQ
ncbi:MAG TPA: hypothetical protein VGH74_09320 [Planctomycetaceae bacterium]|jgi:hypothetical protein